MSEWIDIKKAKAGDYIYVSLADDNAELIHINGNGFVSGVNQCGSDWSDRIERMDGYVKTSKAVDICPLLDGGES